MFFSGIFYEFVNKNKKRNNFETVEGKNLKLDLSWGTYESFLVQILGAIGHAIRVSEPKNETPILGLNSSSSKTNGTRGIKLSNLEASGPV